MEKIINQLVELANEGQKEMLVVYDLNNELSLNMVYDKPCIPEDFIVGEINLKVYNTYEDIKEELENMLED